MKTQSYLPARRFWALLMFKFCQLLPPTRMTPVNELCRSLLLISGLETPDSSAPGLRRASLLDSVDWSVSVAKDESEIKVGRSLPSGLRKSSRWVSVCPDVRLMSRWLKSAVTPFLEGRLSLWISPAPGNSMFLLFSPDKNAHIRSKMAAPAWPVLLLWSYRNHWSDTWHPGAEFWKYCKMPRFSHLSRLKLLRGHLKGIEARSESRMSACTRFPILGWAWIALQRQFCSFQSDR